MEKIGLRLVLIACLVLAPFCLALGVTLPLIRFETLYVFDSAPSLVDIVSSLALDGDFALAVIVALVSILFPLVKIFVIAAEVTDLPLAPKGRFARTLPQLARWSLMDVLIVAVVIVAAKTGGIATALSQPGLWFYLASASLALIAHMICGRLRRETE
ncbi:paraquat-inducible protein A [Pseudohoeflea suaedae]|uniref:Paraquat-inducible protein A n=1 Tax=Pseudohoeflea suaedae TaxID=877384 RepID=A0A4V3A6Z8_9HYPH|nr:paraquat-inducible protein A [Pseudohoeflea suaedae]TDH35138.1 paraquat-inducible protein A [Pseudohoeflea suaedae]